jgi:hypothetical protein
MKVKRLITHLPFSCGRHIALNKRNRATIAHENTGNGNPQKVDRSKNASFAAPEVRQRLPNSAASGQVARR